jgi:hypothetical protein
MPANQIRNSIISSLATNKSSEETVKTVDYYLGRYHEEVRENVIEECKEVCDYVEKMLSTSSRKVHMSLFSRLYMSFMTFIDVGKVFKTFHYTASIILKAALEVQKTEPHPPYPPLSSTADENE